MQPRSGGDADLGVIQQFKCTARDTNIQKQTDERFGLSSSRMKPMVPHGQGALRAWVRDRTDLSTLRDVAARVGVSHYSVWRFRRGLAVRPLTVMRIDSWRRKPSETAAVEDPRKALRRVLGRLGPRAARSVEGELGRVIRRFYRSNGVETPKWIERLGKTQV